MCPRFTLIDMNINQSHKGVINHYCERMVNALLDTVSNDKNRNKPLLNEETSAHVGYNCESTAVIMQIEQLILTYWGSF